MKTKVLLFSTLVALFIVAIALRSCLKVFYDYELVQILPLRGSPIYQQAGIAFVSPFSKVLRFDTRSQTITIDKLEADSEGRTGIGCVSKDGVHLTVSLTVYYRVNKTKAANFVANYWHDDDASIRSNLVAQIEDRVATAVRSLVPLYPAEYLLANRDVLQQNICYYLGYPQTQWKPAHFTYMNKDGQQEDCVLDRYDTTDLDKSLPDTGVEIYWVTASLNFPKKWLEESDKESMLRKMAETTALEKKNVEDENAVNDRRLQFREREEEQQLRLDSERATQPGAIQSSAVRQFFERWDGHLPSILSVGSSNVPGGINLSLDGNDLLRTREMERARTNALFIGRLSPKESKGPAADSSAGQVPQPNSTMSAPPNP